MGWFSRKNFEISIDLWHRLKGGAMSRRAGYLILAAVALETDVLQLLIEGGFAFVNIKINIPETPHWVSVSFAGFAVILLVADRYLPLANVRQPPNPHDVELFKRFRELFNDDVMYFLRHHDFGNSFHIRYFKAFNEISTSWLGSRYQFDDAELALVWSELLPKNRELADLIATYTIPTGNKFDWCQPYWFNEDWHSDETIKRVKLMNNIGTEMAELIDKLEAEARRRWISTPAT